MRIAQTGEIVVDYAGEQHFWLTAAALAEEYWRFHRLPDREKEQTDSPAADVLDDFVLPGGNPGLNLLIVLDALVEQATEDELFYLGAGLLEDLMRVEEWADRLIDAVESRARTNPRWATAISGIWLGHDSSHEANVRLAAFGAKYADGQIPT